MEATQDEGVSIHEKLLNKLQPELPEEDVQPKVEEETEVEAIDEPEVEQDEPAETSEDPEERTYELDQVAEILGLEIDQLDVNDDGQLLIKTKVGNDIGHATLQQLVKERQLEGHLNKQNTEVAEIKKQLETKLSEVNSQAQTKVDEANRFIQAAYQLVMNEYESVDWNDLKQNDREEYLIKQQEFQERQNALGHLYQQLKDSAPKEDPEVIQQKIQDEQQKLAKAIPEWANREVMEKEWKNIGSYAVNLGYSIDDLNRIKDHKSIVILRKAMFYDDLMKDSPKVTKQVRKAPKIVKPGTVAKKPTNDEKTVSNLRARLKKDGNDKEAIHQLLLRKV